MKKTEHNEPLGCPTLGYVSASLAHVRRFMLPEIKRHALYDHFIRCSFGLVLGRGYRRRTRIGCSRQERAIPSCEAPSHGLRFVNARAGQQLGAFEASEEPGVMVYTCIKEFQHSCELSFSVFLLCWTPMRVPHRFPSFTVLFPTMRVFCCEPKRAAHRFPNADE